MIIAIGDLQGCAQSLLRLIESIDDDRSAHAQWWFCGDLVNRGPDSLATLRAIRALGERAVTVDRKSTRLNSSHIPLSRMPSSA